MQKEIMNLKLGLQRRDTAAVKHRILRYQKVNELDSGNRNKYELAVEGDDNMKQEVGAPVGGKKIRYKMLMRIIPVN